VTRTRGSTELLDVDVDQLTRPAPFVALCGLQADAAELAHPNPGQDPRHGRERHAQRLGDLCASHPQPPQSGDHLDPSLIGPVGHDRRRRRAIQQPARALSEVSV
jgi:hypothetical protein